MIKTFVHAFLFATWCGLAAHAHAAAGHLDPSFAKTGMTRLGFGFGEDAARAVAVQPDGKLVVAGTSGPNGWVDEHFVRGHFSLARFDTNNAPDFSFGFGGTVITPVTPPGLDWTDGTATSVKIQNDGKIVVAGYAYTRTNHYDFTLVRYHADGSLDTAFGTDGTGIVYTDFGDGSMIRDMAIQPDGKIVVVGHTTYQANAGEGAVALARYLTNGLLDGSFGSGGKQITTGITGYTGAHAMTIQPDGKILTAGIGIGAGHGGIDFGLYRYTTNGVLDGTFGGGSGKVFTAITTNASSYNYFDSANAVTIQPGTFTVNNPDKIIVAGTYRNLNGTGQTVIALARYGMDGTLDSTFGNGGIVTNGIAGARATAHAVMIQGGFVSRKILVAGTTASGGRSSFVLARYTLAGALDGTFNGTGYVITPIGTECEASAMTYQAGKIVVAGYSRVNQRNTDFAVARYNTDGTPDPSFGNDGVLTLGVADRNAPGKAVAVQPDGKIVVAGYADDGLKEVVALARLNPDGLPDVTFGTFGRVTTAIGTGTARANAVAIQPDGKILAAGLAGDQVAVVRYHPNGVPDSSFGNAGVANTTVGPGSAEANAMALQADGKIVVIGSAYNGANMDFAVVRYTTNGTPDSTFDFDGKVITPIGAQHDLASAVEIQADGKILVAGSSVIGTAVDIAVVRYNTNGSVDNTFGTLGRAITDFGGGSHDFGQTLAIQPDGKILVGGFTANGPITFAAVRYQTNGLLDNSFDGDGRVSTTVGLGLDDRGFAMVLQPDGKIILAGTSTAGGPQFSAVRYHGSGLLDTSFGTGGRVISEFDNAVGNIGYALALDSMGRAIIAGDAGGLFGVVRLQGNSVSLIRSIVPTSDGRMILEGLGTPGVTQTIQASTDTKTFAPLGTVTPDQQGFWQYQDESAPDAPMRFYRVLIP